MLDLWPALLVTVFLSTGLVSTGLVSVRSSKRLAQFSKHPFFKYPFLAIAKDFSCQIAKVTSTRLPVIP